MLSNKSLWQIIQVGLVVATMLASPSWALARKKHSRSGVTETGGHSREIPINSGRTIRQQIDTLVELMLKELAVAKKSKEKFQTLLRTEEQISALRENAPALAVQDEVYVDLLMSVLKSLPAEKEFKKRDCEKYRVDLLDQFEPTAEDAPQEMAVKPGWEALQLLCD